MVGNTYPGQATGYENPAPIVGNQYPGQATGYENPAPIVGNQNPGQYQSMPGAAGAGVPDRGAQNLTPA